VRNCTTTNFQLDSIKTAGSRNYGDGNFYIHSKERGYNFDDFLGDFDSVLQRNRNWDHLGAGGQHHTPPHSPNSSVHSNQNASPPFNASPGISDAPPPTSSDSEDNSDTDSDDPLALTDTEDPFNYLAHALTASAPSSYREAKASGEWEHWKPAMGLAKMDQYKVWEVVDRQPNMRVVGARWVYRCQIDGNTGKPTSYKARWVAKGYSQREGINFNEFYAAVAHKDTIRVQSTCYDTFVAQPSSVSCSMATPESEFFSATRMPTGEVTWTLDVQPLATFSKSYSMIFNLDRPRTRQSQSTTTTMAALHSQKTRCTMTSRSTLPCVTTSFTRKSRTVQSTYPTFLQPVTLRTC
jgi:hypothetical protein